MKHWQSLLANGYRTIESLPETLLLSEDEKNSLKQIQEQFPIFTNPYYFSLIDPSDSNDPIRKMSIPSPEESNKTGSFDTSGEQDNTVLPRSAAQVQRYSSSFIDKSVCNVLPALFQKKAGRTD